MNFRTSFGINNYHSSGIFYNRNIYTAIYDVDLKRTTLYWLHPYAGRKNIWAFTSYDYENDFMQCSTFDEEGMLIENGRCGVTYKSDIEHTQISKYNFTFGKNVSTIEPRIEKMGDYYYFLLQSHTFAPWDKNHILVTLSSWVITNGSLSVDSPPGNTLTYFPVDKAIPGTIPSGSSFSHAPATSASLYLNTHKFVTYSKEDKTYVIYAYCYPEDPNENKAQLFLGVCCYFVDDKGYAHLYTKREFKQRTSKTNPNTYTSFGNLTDCSRIISMDVKNGHLWIVFASANEELFYYFYAKADDIIKFAP